MLEQAKRDGIDFVGLGKIAKAIPPEVYTRSAEVLLKTFEKLTAPLTETTDGFGRYLCQKFNNMVEVEKQLAVYSLEEAMLKAEKKLSDRQHRPKSLEHPKSFIRTLEESSKETSPILHDMWVNLLAKQLVDGESNPHFIEVLTHFGPADARLLLGLLDRDAVGDHGGNYIAFAYDYFKYWVRKVGDTENPWTLSCLLLCEFNLASVLALKGQPHRNELTVLHRTSTGGAFLRAVMDDESRL